MDLGPLLEAVQRRHRALLAEAREVKRVVQAQGAPERFVGLVLALSDALRFHLLREERFLLPALRALDAGEAGAEDSLRGTMDTMIEEHEELRALDRALRAEIDDAGEATPRVIALLDQIEAHHAAEDDMLFPAVRARIVPPPARRPR